MNFVVGLVSQSSNKAALSLFKYVILTEDAISDEDDGNHERKYCVLKWQPSSLPEILSSARTTFFATSPTLYEKTSRNMLMNFVGWPGISIHIIDTIFRSIS